MSTPSETPPDADALGWMDRLGDVSLRSLAVVALATVPTALRTSGAGGSFVGGLLVGMGVLLPLVLFALLLSRAAGRGFRQLMGAQSPRPAVLAVALWVSLTTPLLVGLGAALKATTHHLGLAGTTFGVFALVVAAAAAVVAHRLVNLGQTLVERGVRPWIPAVIGAAVGGLPLLAVAIPLGSRGDDPGGPAVRAAILDGAIVVVATALAAVTRLGDSLRRIGRLAGVPVAATLFIAAFATVESSPSLARAMHKGGGLASTILGALEHWSDRDNDGVGAHFGGDDCDEGDPTRHPGAAEIPGDGIDQDCDGIDPPRPSVVAVTEPPSAGPTHPASHARAVAAHPDIVLVTLDSVRADHTSAFGYDKPTTPHLAELADRGARFLHAYAAGADPQRALSPLVTGKHLADVARDKREWPTILPGNDTVAERLKRSGYRTAGVTSFTWLSRERGFAQGFDYWKPIFEGVHPEREVTGHLAIRAALSVWKELEADAHPIFLWVHLFDAHERYLEHPGIHIASKTPAYDGEIAYVDKQLGELVAAITASPRGAKVAWIVHGSQGEAFDEHDEHGHSGVVYEEALHVPLVVTLPDGKPGVRDDARAVSVMDIPATIADLAGAPMDGLAGASLAAIARGEADAHRAPVYARGQRRVALIDWPLKLMVMERKKSDRALLFDLAADPGEKEDLTATRGADVERLQKEKAALEKAPSTGEATKPPLQAPSAKEGSP